MRNAPDVDAIWTEAMREVRHDARYPLNMAKTATELGYGNANSLKESIKRGNSPLYYVGRDWRKVGSRNVKLDVFAPVKLKPILDKF